MPIGHFHKWTEEELNIIRRDYRGTNESKREIAAKLGQGITRHAVSGQIAKLGLCKKTGRRPWTEQEDKRLRALIGKYSVHTVCKKMHRSLASVVLRAKRIKIRRSSHDGWFTKSDVCAIFGVDHKWVQARIDSRALKARSHNPEERPQKGGGTYWHIDEADLREFILRYPQELEGRNVNMVILVDLLCGVISGPPSSIGESREQLPEDKSEKTKHLDRIKLNRKTFREDPFHEDYATTLVEMR